MFSVANTDGSSSVVIDWKFLELIYSQTESVAKETISRALREPDFGNILDCDNANEDTIEVTIETIEIEAKDNPAQELRIENSSACEITGKSVEAVEDTVKDDKVIDTTFKADDEIKQVDKDDETIGKSIKTGGETEEKAVKNHFKGETIDKPVKNTLKDDESVKDTAIDDKTVINTLKDDKSVKDTAIDNKTVKESDKDNKTIINSVKDDDTVKNTVKDDKTVHKTDEIEHQESSEIVKKPVDEQDVDPVVGVFGEEGASCSAVQAGQTPAALEEMPNPWLAPGQVFEFDSEKYRDAVVMPWYRNQDQPQVSAFYLFL